MPKRNNTYEGQNGGVVKNMTVELDSLGSAPSSATQHLCELDLGLLLCAAASSPVKWETNSTNPKGLFENQVC